MAITNVTTHSIPEKGITYTHITDTSADWTGVTNETYFYNLEDSLPYYKNGSGTVIALFEEAGTSITGGTYNNGTLTLTDSNGGAVDILNVDGTNISNSDLVWTGNTTQDLDSNILAFINGTVKINENANTGTTIGYGTVGGAVASWGSLSHNSHNTSTNFGYAQGSDGTTHINSPEKILFKQNGTEYVRFIDSGTTFFGTAPVCNELISFQEKTLVDDEFYQKALTSAIADGNLCDNYFGFHIDPTTSTLKGRYKDNLGVVTDLKFDIDVPSGLISVNDSSGVPTFYSDLQTAINATADVDTVYIHSDIQITSATTVTIPSRTSLTINLQGHRIWGDTTSGDFTIFTMSSSLNKRALYFTGGGIIETIGTASSVISAAPFIFLNVGSGELKCYFGNTRIQSQNALAFYTNGFKLFNGGVIYSENNSATINGTLLVIENVFFDLYETPTLGKTLNNCRMKTRYGGYSFDQSTTVTNCHLYGTVTKSGNYGLPYIHQGTNFVNNTIIVGSSSTRPALFVRGSSGSNGNISNNKVINLGSGSAGYWVYGNGYNNYCYAANNNAIYVGNNCKKFIGNIAITNSTSHQAMVCYGTLIQDNSATNLDATNTLEALQVGRTSATTSEIYNNKAEVANAAAYNMKLTSTGTLYYANNVMGLTGLGLDTNGNTNAMVNTTDAYGNIKLG